MFETVPGYHEFCEMQFFRVLCNYVVSISFRTINCSRIDRT